MRTVDDGDRFAAPSASEIDELAERSESLEQRITSLNDSYETLKKREVELTEWRWVLREAGGFFDRVRIHMALRTGFCLRLTRLMVILTIYGNPPITTRRPFFRTSNSTPLDKMENHRAKPHFQ